MPNNNDCEILVKGRWTRLSVRSAKKLKPKLVRCPECKGAVKLMGKKASDAIYRPHTEHRERFWGCSRGDCFDGKHRINPNALGLNDPADNVQVEIETLVESDNAVHSGQGIRITQEQRRQIEDLAVAHATRHFESLGYRVKDVGSTKCYDLECVKGKTVLRVEVKGTQTDGKSVILTTNEVLSAKRHSTALFILHGIRFAGKRTSQTATGGKPTIFFPWKIDRCGTLRPLSYTYTLQDD